MAVTSDVGQVLQVNEELLRIVGRNLSDWRGVQIDDMMPHAVRIFLQTHVWPMLYRNGSIREIHLELQGSQGQILPVMVNCDRLPSADGKTTYIWVIFPAEERSRFEIELLAARKRADTAAATLLDRERFLRTVTDALPGLVAYWDKDLICRFANSSHGEWYGKGQRELLGCHIREVMGDEVFEQKRPQVEAVLAGEDLSFESRMSVSDDKIRHHLHHYIPHRNDAGEVQGFFVLSVDVSALKEAETERQLSERVVNSTAEGIMVTDVHGTVRSVNPAFTRITGYSEQEMRGTNFRVLLAGNHEPDFYEILRKDVDANGTWQGETWARRKNGDRFLAWWNHTLIPLTDDAPARYVTLFHDVTSRWQNDERLRHLALHDPLTDLPNRTLLNERLERLMGQTAREPRRLAILFVDLDCFKAVNDEKGHATGDALLKEVAQRLLALVRRSDTVARLGGDEFVLVLDNPSDRQEVAQVAQRVIDTVAMPLAVGGGEIQLGASVGIALYPGDAEERDQLLACADAALYEAKSAGKGSQRFFCDLNQGSRKS